MLGFKGFETAAVTIRGIELAEKIKKRQFNLRPLTGKAAHRSGNVGQGLGSLNSGESFTRQKHTLNKICTRTFWDTPLQKCCYCPIKSIFITFFPPVWISRTVKSAASSITPTSSLSASLLSRYFGILPTDKLNICTACWISCRF
jgi:hypothetical protein